MAVSSLGVLASNKDAPVAVTVALLGALAIAGFAVVYIVLFDRDRLMTEEYLIRSRILKLMEEKGTRKAVDAVTQKVVTKPEFIRLPEPPTGGAS